MERHDHLIDSCDMGDERIYFANKECEAIKAEQRRRGYKTCDLCFDFGDVTDMHGDFYGFCKCPAGVRLREKTERRIAIREELSKAEEGK
jgi:hypothetical protein